MRKSDKVWIVAFMLFWLSFIVTFLVDYLGIIETSNIGYVETIWISWLVWTAGLGIALVIIASFVIKE